ncbi:DUF1810 domain-containing protein [Bosea sp. Root381]|uniref:DUF1810 domain-containing protein n=1 Tax=Bosea sp. Root381 TaxID=1736524 RepID=UPI000A9C9667|nr:DUF1810 domain-containing protein [Bosea sp. Root381]
MADASRLDRFVTAQAPLFDKALAELAAGRKRSHWMWFIFPQLRGLGISATAQQFGIADLAEARAYLAHLLLGPRLKRCTEAVLAIEDRDLHAIFGTPDDLKFASSMTLFSLASDERDNLFRQAILRCCGGRMDARSLQLLGG